MVQRPIHKLGPSGLTAGFDDLADESVITMYCGDDVVVRLLATPQDLEDLAIGHIACEDRGNIDSIIVQGTDILMNGTIKPRPKDDLLTAACGACTTGDIEIPNNFVSHSVKTKISPKAFIDSMTKNQPIFDTCGGVHAAALFTTEGELKFIREDIGRHNALDKVVGAAIKSNFEVNKSILVLSGRMGWELVAKALRVEIELIFSIGAISSGAERLARASGMTLVGFACKESPYVVGPAFRIIDKPSKEGVD